MKLNLGCGTRHLDGYTNVDVAQRNGKQPDIESDIRKLPFEDNSIDEIIAIHVIEHFYKWEIQDILKEWRRVLVPHGTIILECPDISKAASHMINCIVSDMGISDQYVMWALYGDPGHQDPLMCHRWGYTPQTLGNELISAGFYEIQSEPAQFHKRHVRDLRVVGKKQPGGENA